MLKVYRHFNKYQELCLPLYWPIGRRCFNAIPNYCLVSEYRNPLDFKIMKKNFKVSGKVQIEFSWTIAPKSKGEHTKCSLWLSIVDSLLSIVASIKSLF